MLCQHCHEQVLCLEENFLQHSECCTCVSRPNNTYRYVCCFCDFHTEHVTDINAHLGKHFENKAFKCDKCSYGTNIKKCMKRHVERIHLNITKTRCELCDLRFFDKVGLKMHVMRKHTGEKPFHCHYCDYICRTKYDLGSHIGRKHTDKEVLEKRYVCQLCPKQFLTSGELKYHQTTVHRKRVHECSECGFTFFLEKTLRAHIRETHRKETPFPCPFCEYKAKRKFELKSHMKRKHTFEDSLTTEETEYYKILES